MPLQYTQTLSMVKKLGANSWLTALKRVFRYPGRKSRQCKQEKEEEETATAAAVEIISRTPPPPPPSRLLSAATVIQTAFRCYLAKRALVALKGIVKLQALIRGQNVRRQARITLKCMQALFRVQDRMREQCARISQDSGRKSVFTEPNNSWESKYIRERKSIFSDAWRDCPPTLQELEVMLQAHKAAFMRDSDADVVDGEERGKEWVALKQGRISSRGLTTQRRNLNPRHKRSLSSSPVQAPATPSPAKPKLVRRLEKCHSTGNTPQFSAANRSTSFAPRYSTSAMVPSYMAATESAKARHRSQSAPRQRPSKPGGSARKRLAYAAASAFKNGEAGMEQRSEYSCNTESVGGEISPCSTTNSRWWSR